MTSKFKMIREFLVFQWEHHDAQVKNLQAEIRLLEKRKLVLWECIGTLDKLEKAEK